MTRVRSEYVIVDLETGLQLDGEPDDPLASAGRGEAWRHPGDGTWRLRGGHDPRGVRYRVVQVFGGPGLDASWYEDTVENLDTSEG